MVFPVFESAVKIVFIDEQSLYIDVPVVSKMRQRSCLKQFLM